MIAVNRALGLLIGRGYEPDEARAELARSAAAAATDLGTAATRLLGR